MLSLPDSISCVFCAIGGSVMMSEGHLDDHLEMMVMDMSIIL